MKRLGLPLVFVGITGALAGASSAEAPRTVEGFDERGVIVDVHTFFAAAASKAGAVEVAHASTAGLALVTEEGVYAFLENPENASHLAQVEPGSVVQVKGKLLKAGALLHIESLEKQTTVPLIDFARFRNDSGAEVALSGVNKCQCGLDVGSLPHSCELGHLHHLEAADGRIYHYLQFALGQKVFLGEGYHFQRVAVKGRLLPGNYLWVQDAQVE